VVWWGGAGTRWLVRTHGLAHTWAWLGTRAGQVEWVDEMPEAERPQESNTESVLADLKVSDLPRPSAALPPPQCPLSSLAHSLSPFPARASARPHSLVLV